MNMFIMLRVVMRAVSGRLRCRWLLRRRSNNQLAGSLLRHVYGTDGLLQWVA